MSLFTAISVSARTDILSCTDCELSQHVTTPVPFSGPSPNPFVVVGEAPGEDEDKQGEPFVGPAGRLLRRAIDVAFGEQGYNEAFSYLNAVSCYPKGTPRPAHLAACQKHLESQLALLNPRYALVVGGVALNALWPHTDAPLSIATYRASWLMRPNDGCFYYPTWHPSAVLRAGGLNTTKGTEMMRDLEGYAAAVLKFSSSITCTAIES